MSLPHPLVEAYWLGYGDSQQFGGQGLDLSQVASQAPVDVVKIAFYNLYPNNGVSVCFGMGHSHGWSYTQQAIQTLQAVGIKVMASLIGTPDPQVGWNDIANPTTFAENVKGLLIDQLGCDGIDIDNEDSDTPNQTFVEVVRALRSVLGPKGSGKALLTAVSYIPDRDLPWLRQAGEDLDWLSTMAYWLDTQGQIALWEKYADVLGASNVLIGVSCCSGGQSTDLSTVEQVAQWETRKGEGSTGGMMLWNLSGGSSSQQYYEAIRQNLTIWSPPETVGSASA